MFIKAMPKLCAGQAIPYPWPGGMVFSKIYERAVHASHMQTRLARGLIRLGKLKPVHIHILQKAFHCLVSAGYIILERIFFFAGGTTHMRLQTGPLNMEIVAACGTP